MVTIKLVGTLVSIVVAIFLWLLAYKLGWKYMVQEKHCTAKTTGKIVGYTIGGRADGKVRLPRVEYQVDGQNYKITGPEYKNYIVKSKHSSRLKNTEINYTIDPYAQVFRYQYQSSSFIQIQANPMTEMFPMDSIIDVYYDPSNPKLAYVLRYADLKWLFYLLAGGGIFILILNLLLLMFIK